MRAHKNARSEEPDRDGWQQVTARVGDGEQKTNLDTQFRIMFRGPTANYV